MTCVLGSLRVAGVLGNYIKIKDLGKNIGIVVLIHECF